MKVDKVKKEKVKKEEEKKVKDNKTCCDCKEELKRYKEETNLRF